MFVDDKDSPICISLEMVEFSSIDFLSLFGGRPQVRDLTPPDSVLLRQSRTTSSRWLLRTNVMEDNLKQRLDLGHVPTLCGRLGSKST
jgi:hypothetical protein